MKKIYLLLFLTIIYSENLTNSSVINITKIWPQEPSGWTYPIYIKVPEINTYENRFPICILLHGFGGNGENILTGWENFLDDHILIAPTGYMNSWNISDEPSEAPDIEMIDDLVNQLQTFNNINPNKIRILGTSNGSALANRIFIENTNSGIEIVCAIVSQLSEAQFHNNNFYYPSSNTGNNQEFNGYDMITFPITGRKYLNIGNTNDPTIPYYGGNSVGINFLNSLNAIYIIATSQGYQGNQLIGEGNQIDSYSVFEYSYLSNQIVHLKGDSGHTINEIQREYIVDFFELNSSCDFSTDIECNNNQNCDWIENIENINCSDFDEEYSCDEYSECNWLCLGTMWGGQCLGVGYGCDGGFIQVDNSYCLESEFELGDINGDLVINIIDVIYIINIILSIEAFDELADINIDGLIDILDIVQLVNIILDN